MSNLFLFNSVLDLIKGKCKYFTVFQVVLVNPDIPYNTGNIGRLCVGLNARLHLVKPLGFELSDKYVKRAGLDYWKDLDLKVHESYEDFIKSVGDARLIFVSTKGKNLYFDYKFLEGDYLVFGCESAGLPEKIIKDNYDATITIPMPGKVRSLNLSNAVSVILYEAYKQNFIS